jgi:hypothetical protein
MSSNRQQRRAAARHKGKRPGENYADYLSRERQIREAIDRSVHDTSVEIIADQKRQILLWEAVVALNRKYGYAEKRAMDFMKALDEVHLELCDIAREDGRYVATEHLRKEVSRISGMEVKLIHMDEIAQAKAENEAKGVYFPEEDQDIKEWW